MISPSENVDEYKETDNDSENFLIYITLLLETQSQYLFTI